MRSIEKLLYLTDGISAPDIVFEHVGQATFPTSIFVAKPFGKVENIRALIIIIHDLPILPAWHTLLVAK